MITISDGKPNLPDPPVERSPASHIPDYSVANVLVVEDNSITQLVTLTQLRALGCVPQTVESGFAALEALRDRRFDLILLDCFLPDLTGYETARAIRTFEQSGAREPAAIVAITSDSDIACVDSCLAAGMDGHLSKPTTVAALRTVFERFLS